MNHLKNYKSFSINEELDIDIDSAAGQHMVQEISDIFFIHVKDCGLEVADVYLGHALSMGEKDIVTDHREFETILGPDGRYVGSFKSLSIRLKTYKKDDTDRPNFYIDNDLYSELESAISHTESQFNLKLSSIYLRTGSGVWFSSVQRMKRYIDELPFAKKSALRWVSYLDLTFRVLDDEDVDDSISVSEARVYDLTVMKLPIPMAEIQNDIRTLKEILYDIEDVDDVPSEIKTWFPDYISVSINKDNWYMGWELNRSFSFSENILNNLKRISDYFRSENYHLDFRYLELTSSEGDTNWETLYLGNLKLYDLSKLKSKKILKIEIKIV